MLQISSSVTTRSYSCHNYYLLITNNMMYMLEIVASMKENLESMADVFRSSLWPYFCGVFWLVSPLRFLGTVCVYLWLFGLFVAFCGVCGTLWLFVAFCGSLWFIISLCNVFCSRQHAFFKNCKITSVSSRDVMMSDFCKKNRKCFSQWY